MNEKFCCWTNQGNQSILLKWTELPFVCKSTITWRGITFHIKVESYKIENGQHTKFKVVLNNQIFFWGLGRWKYMAGGIGDGKPDIHCATHFLSIKNNFYSISFTDKPNNSSALAAKNKFNPFEIS